MKTSVIGISLPKETLQKIDTERGDINRSRYILRLIESSTARKTETEAKN